MLRVHALRDRATRAAALLATAAVLFNLSSFAARAASRVARHAGEVTFANGVAVDGSPAVQGQTFFSGSRLEAARDSQSVFSLDNLARLELSDGAALALDFDGVSAGGALEAGRLRVYAPRGVAARFSTADARVNTDVREAVSFGLRTYEGFTEVSVQSGALEVRAGGAARLLKAGESFTTAPEPRPKPNLSGRRRVGLYAAIASAVAIVALILIARDNNTPVQNCEGGPIIPSAGSGIINPCQ